MNSEHENTTTDPEWIADATEKLPDSTDNYEIEMWLSTDGKHTVKILAKDPASRRAGVKKGMELYDYILARYGTKQAQAVKEYAKEPPDQKAQQETCEHVKTKLFQVKKTGNNQGKWFSTCEKCSKFLGFKS